MSNDRNWRRGLNHLAWLSLLLLFVIAVTTAADSPQKRVTSLFIANDYFSPLLDSSPTLGGCGEQSWLARGDCYIKAEDGTPLYHLGVDMVRINGAATKLGDPVFAIANGEVIRISPRDPRDGDAGWGITDGIPNVALLIQHRRNDGSADGSPFVALYGHIQSSLKLHDLVTGGTRIGTLGHYGGGPHLHFSVFPTVESALLATHLGNYPDPGRRVSTEDLPTYGQTEPIGWLNTTAPQCTNSTSERYELGGRPPHHPNGSLLRLKNEPAVWVLEWGYRRVIPNPPRLWELYGPGRGFDFRDVITVSSAEFNSYPVGPAVDGPLAYADHRFEPPGRLIRQVGGRGVSIVDNAGRRRAFKSLDTFLLLGYSLCNVASVTNYFDYTLTDPIEDDPAERPTELFPSPEPTPAPNPPSPTPPPPSTPAPPAPAPTPSPSPAPTPGPAPTPTPAPTPGPTLPNVTLRIDSSTYSSHPIGQTFYFDGSGYTPGGVVTRSISPAVNGSTSLPPLTANIWGEIEWTFSPTCGNPIDTFTITAFDVGSNRRSNPVTQRVTPSSSCP